MFSSPASRLRLLNSSLTSLTNIKQFNKYRHVQFTTRHFQSSTNTPIGYRTGYLRIQSRPDLRAHHLPSIRNSVLPRTAFIQRNMSTTITAATTTTASSSSPKRIAVVIGSTRKPRVGPSVAELVHSTLASDASLTTAWPVPVSLEMLDIADFSLPIFDEPGIPQQIKTSEGYAHAHTQAWSRAVASYDGFVFVTPQYNWSVPAALKNAIDYLFNEWTGKPALIVSYGGRGGGKGADHLRDIINGLRMNVVEESVGFPMHGFEGAMGAAIQGQLWEGASEAWKSELDKTKTLFTELVRRLAKGQESKA